MAATKLGIRKVYYSTHDFSKFGVDDQQYRAADSVSVHYCEIHL